MTDELRPFRVEVPDAVLDDLRDRLARTRWPDQIPNSAWDYGTDLAYLQDLCDHWQHDVRLACAGGPLQPVAALPHRDRRRSRSTSSTRARPNPTRSR